MKWLNKIVEEALARHPQGEILIESGSSPSGTYHMGHLREFVTCDAVLIELRRRGRQARHIAYVDDLDALRKIPVNIPSEFKEFLGRPLCDIPSPGGNAASYADYFLQGIINATRVLNIEVEFIRTHEKYRAGFFVAAIEKALAHEKEIRHILETVSGHKLGDNWSPVQINEDGYLKKRRFLNINTADKTLTYEDVNGVEKSVGYSRGEVKLDWRVDWPARWWLLGVDIEPFGRDHATKGGSYDTGKGLMEKIFKTPAPMPVPYDFVNLAGDTKKMSASKGTGLDAQEIVKILPPEVFRFFMLRYPPQKRLYFDPINVSPLIDDFAELVAKPDKTEEDNQLIYLSTAGAEPTVSSIPFSHLVASYQAALKDQGRTLEIISRTEHHKIAQNQKDIILKELKFIDEWLQKWAPEEIKFELLINPPLDLDEKTKKYLSQLSNKIAQLPQAADGEIFHKMIYESDKSSEFAPKQRFEAIYRVLIGKNSGPRAGWFLSILPRDWLIKRLRLEG